MATYKFTFYSDSLKDGGEFSHRVEVEIDVTAHSEDDYGFDIDYIYDETAQKKRQLDEFSLDEQRAIEKKAEDLAYEKSYESYQDYLQMRADALYDQIREEGWE